MTLFIIKTMYLIGFTDNQIPYLRGGVSGETGIMFGKSYVLVTKN